MRDKTYKLLIRVSVYILLATLGLIVGIIYYEYLQQIFPTESNFWIFPFNTASFVFGLTFIFGSVFIFILALYCRKVRRLKKEYEKKRYL